MSSFADCLKHAMEEAHCNQADLSARTGISKASVSQYLSGKNQPSKARLNLLAETLNVSPDWLNGYPTEKAPAPVLPACMPRKITTDQAAQCLGKHSQFVREGLKRGILPFGNAVPGTGDKFTYYISPVKFREYVGAEIFDSFFGLTA